MQTNSHESQTDPRIDSSALSQAEPGIRHDWLTNEAEALFVLPFMDLVHRAQSLHRQHFNANEVQMSNLLSIKTGGCPEDCGYCPQSSHHHANVAAEKLKPFKKESSNSL